MSAHTPGLWRIRACGCCCEDADCAVVVSRPDDLDIIAQIVRDHNAHAELVAACESALCAEESGKHKDKMIAVKAIRTALAKAGAA